MRHVVVAFVGVILFFAPVQAAQWSVNSFSADITINTDASIIVTETVKANFDVPKHGIFRKIPYAYKNPDDPNQLVTVPIDEITITDGSGNSVQYEQDDDAGSVVLKIGNPKKTVTGAQTYVLKYQARAAVNFLADHDELYWNATGTDWEVPLPNVSATVQYPAQLDPASVQFVCYTGAAGSRQQRCDRNIGPNDVTATASDLLTVVVGIPKGVVVKPDDYEAVRASASASARGSSDDFTKRFTPLMIALNLLAVLLAAAGLAAWWRAHGRDPAGKATRVAQYDPPMGLRPAEVGVVTDERANTVDLTATIVDLAVRGYLKIREMAEDKWLGLRTERGYAFVKLKEPDAALKEYERLILEGIFKQADGNEVKMSELKKEYYRELPGIKSALYREVVSERLFVTDPQKIRTMYFIIGLALAIVGGFLVIFGFFGLSIVGGLILLFSGTLPKRTARGVEANWHAHGFREYLKTAEKYRLQWQEKERIFEQFLPYAMVFKVADKWSKAFAGVAQAQPSWYEGTAGSTFNSLMLWSAIDGFSTHTQHSFFSPPAAAGSSGFGSGGFSGGGFGGGGGGSW